MEEVNVRELSDEGKIWFTIRANDTEQNSLIHKGFKEYCKVECNNDYTQGLKRLLELADGESKFEILYAKVVELEERINSLENKGEKEEEPNNGTF